MGFLGAVLLIYWFKRDCLWMLCRFPMRNGYRRERDEIHSQRPRGGRPPGRRCGIAAGRGAVLLERLCSGVLPSTALRLYASPVLGSPLCGTSLCGTVLSRLVIEPTVGDASTAPPAQAGGAVCCSRAGRFPENDAVLPFAFNGTV